MKVRCGRPKCSVECRRLWAWKLAVCALYSFQTLPPSHHLVLHPPDGMSERTLAALVGKWLVKLKRRLGGDLEYARVFEWQSGRVHAHVWFRTSQKVTSKLVRAILPPDVVFSCDSRRGSIIAAAKYMFKDVKNAEQKTQLPPLHFGGKLFVSSRGFFTQPVRELWKAVRAEWEDRIQQRPRAE